MNDESILHQLESRGKQAPRVTLPGGEEGTRTSGAVRYELLGEIAREHLAYCLVHQPSTIVNSTAPDNAIPLRAPGSATMSCTK